MLREFLQLLSTENVDLDRRGFIKGSGVVLAALVLAGCGVEASEPHPKSTPTVFYPNEEELVEVIEPILTAEDFLKFPARVRLNLIETVGVPEGMDLHLELISATVDVCSEFVPGTTPDEIKPLVSILPDSEYMTQVVADRKRDMGVQILPDYEMKAIENSSGTRTTDGRILLNLDKAKVEVDGLLKQEPGIDLRLGRNLELIALKSTLIHELAHHFASNQVSVIEKPISVGPNGDSRQVIFDQIHGFVYVGRNVDGKKVEFPPPLEALTEAASIIVGREMGVYFSGGYTQGAELVLKINLAQQLSTTDYLEIYTGQMEMNELFKAWGKNVAEDHAIQSGQMALLLVGMMTNGDMGELEAKNSISNLLGIPVGYLASRGAGELTDVVRQFIDMLVGVKETL